MPTVHGQESEVDCFGQKYKVRLYVSKYLKNHDRTAIEALHWDDELEMDLPFGTLTVNVPEVPLEPNQTIIKTWSENEEWVESLVTELGCFDILGIVPCGYTHGLKVQLKEGWTWE